MVVVKEAIPLSRKTRCLIGRVGRSISWLTAGAEESDANITLDLTWTYSISGHVSALDTHQAVNAGDITLTDATDKNFQRTASIDASGNYTLRFVPSGTYHLTIDEAAIEEANTEPSSGTHTVRSFENSRFIVTFLQANL